MNSKTSIVGFISWAENLENFFDTTKCKLFLYSSNFLKNFLKNNLTKKVQLYLIF